MKNIKSFLSENFPVFGGELFYIYLYMHVFVMDEFQTVLRRPVWVYYLLEMPKHFI